MRGREGARPGARPGSFWVALRGRLFTWGRNGSPPSERTSLTQLRAVCRSPAAGCAPSCARTRSQIQNRICTSPVSKCTLGMIVKMRYGGLGNNPVIELISALAWTGGFRTYRQIRHKGAALHSFLKKKINSLLILRAVLKASIVLTTGTVFHDRNWSVPLIHWVLLNCRPLPSDRPPLLHDDVGKRVMG